MAELLFDRKLLRQNKKRISSKFHEHNFLHHEIADILLENIAAQKAEQSVKPRQFNAALEISAQDDYIYDALKSLKMAQDPLRTFLFEAPKPSQNLADANSTIADDESLPFKAESFDLIVSNLNMHHINIIPQFLMDVKRILQKNGVFIASFFGENNLLELKQAVFEAENTIFGQVSPRFIPVIDVKNAAMLLQKAGFIDPVSSLEIIEVEYQNPMKLLQDIKFMGQGNILLKKDKKFVNRKFFDEILKNYVKIAKTKDGSVKARFEIVVIIGKKG